METHLQKSPMSENFCSENDFNKEILPNQPTRNSLRNKAPKGLSIENDNDNIKRDKNAKKMKFWNEQFDDCDFEQTGGPSYRVLLETDPAREISKHRGNLAKSVLNDEFSCVEGKPSNKKTYLNRSERIIREADDLQYEFDMTIEILSSTIGRLYDFIGILRSANGKIANLPHIKKFFNAIDQKCIESLYVEKKEKEEKMKKWEERKKKENNNKHVLGGEIPVHFTMILKEIPLDEVLKELIEKKEQEIMAKEERSKKFEKIYEKNLHLFWKYCDSC